MATWGTFEDRSRAAKKGWATRRAHEVERGERTPESYEDIYGHSWEEPTEGWWNDWFDEYSDNKSNDELDSDIQRDNSEDNLMTEGEVAHLGLITKLQGFSISTEMSKKTANMLETLRTEDPESYYKILRDKGDQIKTILENTEKSIDYNTFETYETFGHLIEILSDGDISSESWQMEIKEARREDSFQQYHRKKPNAKYGVRRGGAYKG